jgi:hypothetical protein
LITAGAAEEVNMLVIINVLIDLCRRVPFGLRLYFVNLLLDTGGNTRAFLRLVAGRRGQKHYRKDQDNIVHLSIFYCLN